VYKRQGHETAQKMKRSAMGIENEI
jgi:hypothetical protein